MSVSTTKRPQWIPVVVGLIQKQNQVLLGQRPEGASLAGLWEFPGGKIELGENPEEALKRELQEELGIEIQNPQLKMTVSHNYSDTGILLLFYEVLYWQNEPKSLHHSQIRWYDISELQKLSLPEANQKALPEILKVLKSASLST